MKGEEQAQKAHDLLLGIVRRELPSPFDEEHFEKLVAAEDVLCWVLDHTHNPRFAEVLQVLTRHHAKLAELGFVFVDEDGPPIDRSKKPM